MSELKTHKDLDAWKKAMELAQEVHRCTKRFPEDERFGLTSQLRRAAISVPLDHRSQTSVVNLSYEVYSLRSAVSTLAGCDGNG